MKALVAIHPEVPASKQKLVDDCSRDASVKNRILSLLLNHYRSCLYKNLRIPFEMHPMSSLVNRDHLTFLLGS